MSHKVYIYGLYSTEDEIIRYVGKTKTIKIRMAEHRREAKENNTRPKNVWMREVYAKGYDVKLKIIEETNSDEWCEREQYWIAELKESNNLTNILKGGVGGMGAVPKSYMSYDDAKAYINEYMPNIKTQHAYFKEYDNESSFYKSSGLPKYARDVYTYRGEWKCWGDYLNSDTMNSKTKHEQYMSYDDLKAYLTSKCIKTISDYKILASQDTRLPHSKHMRRVYKERWISFRALFGIKPYCRDILKFRRYMSLYFKDVKTLGHYRRLWSQGVINKRLPYHPEKIWKDDYMGGVLWVGT